MPVVLTRRFTPAEIVTRAIMTYAAQQTERERADLAFDWSDLQTGVRYVATWASVSAWPVGPRSVVASVSAIGPDSFGYVASQALDAGSDRSGVDTFDTGLIEQIGPRTYRLTW